MPKRKPKPPRRYGPERDPRDLRRCCFKLSAVVLEWARSTGNASRSIDTALRTSVEFRLWEAEQAKEKQA